MQNLDSLKEIYPFEARTRTFTIPTRLEKYDDFFNPLDPSPAPARDLVPELAEYLDQCSDEIPARFPLSITMEIRKESRSEAREAECRGSLHTYYQHLIFVTQAQVGRKRWQALKYLLVSIVCLGVYLYAGQWNLEVFFWNLFKEAVLIGGWVFMWEAVTLNFIETDGQAAEIKKYRRLIEADLIFNYKILLHS